MIRIKGRFFYICIFGIRQIVFQLFNNGLYSGPVQRVALRVHGDLSIQHEDIGDVRLSVDGIVDQPAAQEEPNTLM